MSLDGSRPPHHKLTFVRALEVRNQVIVMADVHHE